MSTTVSRDYRSPVGSRDRRAGLAPPGRTMSYEEVSKQAEELNYRDKLRLAQLLIQLARKEEEEQNSEKRAVSRSSDPELVGYVAARLRKLRPSKKTTLLNSIGAMFQFRGSRSSPWAERRWRYRVELMRWWLRRKHTK